MSPDTVGWLAGGEVIGIDDSTDTESRMAVLQFACITAAEGGSSIR
jgi:hypothetical protein